MIENGELIKNINKEDFLIFKRDFLNPDYPYGSSISYTFWNTGKYTAFFSLGDCHNIIDIYLEIKDKSELNKVNKFYIDFSNVLNDILKNKDSIKKKEIKKRIVLKRTSPLFDDDAIYDTILEIKFDKKSNILKATFIHWKSKLDNKTIGKKSIYIHGPDDNRFSTHRKVGDSAEFLYEKVETILHYVNDILDHLKTIGNLMDKENNEFVIHPSNDGIDHINVYSKSKSYLGKRLSNFFIKPFDHPIYGNFLTMEGFYYYISTGRVDEQFRNYPGHEAKKIGMSLPKDPTLTRKEFISIVKDGLHICLDQNPEIAIPLIENDLPLLHYYVYGNKDKFKIVIPKDDWLIDTLNEYKEKHKHRIENTSK